MASIVLLLSELLGGESASVVAADAYMGGQSLRAFRPAVTSAAAAAKQGQRRSAAAAGTAPEKESKEETFEDLCSMSHIAVDVMWP
ncbi:hypothetical protein ACP4OV_020564 [Aristida adscensionis]